jgi:cupin fold WbuC family metalloprotein
MAAARGVRPFDDRLLDAVTARARSVARRRHMHNFHGDYAEPLQRMLNALEPESYVQPHRHRPGSDVEVFVALRGRLGVLEFDEAGGACAALVLDPAGPVRGIEIPPGIWHTILALSPGTVVYEVKLGPYDPAGAKDPAPWAPPEGHPDAPAYLARLRAAFAAAPAAPRASIA